MRKTLNLLLVLAPALLAAPGQAQNAAPRLLALSCAGCHGPDGDSPGGVPSLNGRGAAALADALRSFRDGRQPSTVMGRIAKGYSDAEIDALARGIATEWK